MNNLKEQLIEKAYDAHCFAKSFERNGDKKIATEYRGQRNGILMALEVVDDGVSRVDVMCDIIIPRYVAEQKLIEKQTEGVA